MRRFLLPLLLAATLAGCAGPGGVAPGQSESDVRRAMGEPALTWRDAQGQTHLAYPRGPLGYQTWVVRLDRAGKVDAVENVLDEAHFAAIAPGMSREQVLRALGPPQPAWTRYFPARAFCMAT